MGRKKPTVVNGFVLFDVLYEDGTQTSNRKVPAAELGGLDGDEPARTFVETQDRKIGEMSGTSRARIKSIARVSARSKSLARGFGAHPSRRASGPPQDEAAAPHGEERRKATRLKP